MTLKQFVIDILRHDNTNRINFRYGPILVYPEGYKRDVAQLVEDGHILFDITRGAHYTVDARPGQPHHMALPMENIEQTSGSQQYHNAGMLSVKANLGASWESRVSQGAAGFRGTIIHEATHALQDYQRTQTNSQTAEGAAYLAGWMASLLWGYPPLQSDVVPGTDHAYARRLAERRLNGLIGYVIPDAEVRALNALVTTGTASRYVFNGI